MRLVNWRSLVVGAAGFGLAACGDDVVVPTVTPQLTATPGSVSCTVGQQNVPVAVQLTNGSANATFTFASTGTGFSVAQVGTSSAATLNCTAVGSGFVTVTTQGATLQIPVVVTPGQSNILGVQITPPAAAIGVGGTVTLNAQVVTQGTVTPTPVVRYFSLNPTIATVDSTTGVVRGVSAGTADIQAFVRGSALPPAVARITVQQSTLIGSINPGQQSITLSGGGTLQLNPVVTLAAGAPATTSTGLIYRIPAADSLTARVTAGGLVTGGTRAGTTQLTIISQADTNFRITLPITVGAAAPARVSIQDIRTPAGGTVDPTNVAGTVNLVINFEAGDVLADSIVARIGSFQQTCQRFSAGAASLFRAARRGNASVSQVSTLICQVNTAAFDTTNGNARVLNGAQTVSVVLFGRIGATGQTQQQATITRELTLNNISGVAVSVVARPTAAQLANGAPANGRASDPQGRVWLGGDILVRAFNVNYQNLNASTQTGATTVTLVDSATVAAPTFTASQTTDATGLATFPGGFTAPAANTVRGITRILRVQVAGAPARVISTNGGVDSLLVIRVDNQAPPAPTAPEFPAAFRVDPNTATSAAFINGSFGFNTSATGLAISNLTTANTGVQADNGGVDRVRIRFAFDTAANATASFDTVTVASSVAPSNTATTYNLQAQAIDALGNQSNGASTQFGVDIAGPTFTSIQTPANNAQSNAASLNIGFNGLVDNASGVNANAALQASIRRLAPTNEADPTSAANAFCATTSATNPVPFGAGSTTLGRVCETVTLANPAQLDLNGYYFVTQAARDRAGNVTGTETRQFVIDDVAPTATLAAGFALGGPIARGSTISAAPFTFTDNLELIQSYAIEDFGAAGCDNTGAAASVCLAFNGPQLGTLFDNVLTRTATPLLAFPAIGTVSTVAGGVLTTATLQQILGTSTDAGNNIAAPASAPVQAGIITGTLATFAGTQSFNLTAALGNGVTQISTGGGTTGNTTTRTATITAELVGPTATFNNPVSRVELRYFDATLGAFRSAGDLVLTAQEDNGTTRVYRFTGAFSPTNATFLSAQNGGTTTVIAVGYSTSGGDALVSAPVTITLVP